MKIRKHYVIRVSTLQHTAWITNTRGGRFMNPNKYYFDKIFDCTFREAVNNLRILNDNNFYISKLK